jgi:hypothetical protein
MAIIPSNQKFQTLSFEVNTKERYSKTRNDTQEVYLMSDIIDTIGVFNLSYTNVLSAYSTGNQEPSGLDLPLQVTFGAAQGSASDPVMLAADGTITFNDVGVYLINGFGNFERQGSSGGVTVTLWRALIDGVQAGVTKAVELDKIGVMIPYEVTVPLTITTEGTELTYQIMRDSSGIDAGGLYIHGSLGGWSNVPSASMDIYKIGI